MTIWARFYGGSAVAWGEGEPLSAPGQAVRVFASRADRDAVIGASLASRSAKQGEATVESLKSSQEYDGKAENAIRWMSINSGGGGDVGDYTAAGYPWLAIEVDLVPGATPRSAAEAIMAVLNQDLGAQQDGPLKRARRRVALREYLRSL